MPAEFRSLGGRAQEDQLEPIGHPRSGTEFEVCDADETSLGTFVLFPDGLKWIAVAETLTNDLLSCAASFAADVERGDVKIE